MKELKNQPKENSKELKQISYTYIVDSIKKGLNPSQIANELNITPQRLNYYINIAKKKGLIKKIGYGLWEIDPIEELKTSTKATTPQQAVRGHAFIWKVQSKKLKGMNWKDYLNNKQIDYDEIGIYRTPRIIVNNKKIWLGKENIIIYEPKDFSLFGENAIECRKLSIYSLLDTLKALETYLSIQIKDFRFTPNREHYSLIKNALAIQCNKANEKINVYNDKGLWLSIDNSFNLGELENLGSMKNDPMGTNLKVQKWWNSNKDTDFEVDAKFILNSMNGIQSNQAMFMVNIESHIQAIKDISKAVNELREEIKNLRKQNG